MSKDAFYFKHDSNARMDPKCIRLRRIAGLAGYGLFWCVIEMLREAEDYRLPIHVIEDIVYEMRAEQKHFDAIFESGLLVKDEKFFWSTSLFARMESLEEKREQARQAGIKSAESKRNKAKNNDRSTTVQQDFNDRSTTVQPKRKEKIILEKSESDIPFSDFLKEFARASGGKKQPPMFSEAARIRIVRTWETLRENNCKDPASVIKAVITIAMKEMVSKMEKDRSSSPAIFYEPHVIFQDAQFNRYLSLAMGAQE